MLKEIRCDEFKSHNQLRPPIKLHKGLNTVLGGASADNSIGKSTFLLIIDFCFGGSTYMETSVREHIGDHSICFAFEFSDGMHYFSRSTSDHKNVMVCDSEYRAIKTITLREFTDILMSGYHINLPNTTFSELVSRFFRIAGKKNDTNVEKPLNYGSPRDRDAIDALEKLFDQFKHVEDLKKRLNESKAKKETYRDARNLQLIPNDVTTKSQFDKNCKKIEKLENELESLTEDTDEEMLRMELEREDDAAIIESQMREKKRQYSRLTSRYRVVTRNRSEKFSVSKEDMEKLASFFPSVNIRRLEDIEKFHENLQNILDEEIADEAERLKVLRQNILYEIQSLEKNLQKLGVTAQIPKSFLEKYSKLKTEIEELKSQNQAYEKLKEFKEEEHSAKKCLLKTETEVLDKIAERINEQMAVYNNQIYKEQRNAPIIEFKNGTNYRFITPEDEGSGTAYKSMAILDLSILKITQLPALVHDSSVFKNMGDEPFDGLMELYNKSEKQIFIAFDKTSAFSGKTRTILENTRVLQLEDNDELFGRSWAKKKNRQ